MASILIWTLFCVLKATLFINVFAGDINEKQDVKLILKVKEPGDNKDLFLYLQSVNVSNYVQLTPSTYILSYTDFRRNDALCHTISEIERLYNKKNLKLECAREYADTLKPVDDFTNRRLYKSGKGNEIYTNLVCDNYYGMEVEKAWSSGFTGNGVIIAVTDVGINTNLLDLAQNTNTNLHFNFVGNNYNVTPENFVNIHEKSAFLTDHGNRMASIIGATKGNNRCSAGIAYNATIIALKIFTVELVKSSIPVLEPRHWSHSDVIARGLSYKPDTIDIFANAWAPVKPFDKLDMATKDVIKQGATNGRRGLGTIHVVPSGPPGNELSNNIHTITVSGVGRHGVIPDYVYTDASALTSGLGVGNNITSSSMVTTTIGNRCVTGFNGNSAATAQIAAIIGLGLQANKNLTFRDVQHLLVQSSEHSQLKERIAFTRNAAGRHFHGVFGFGLLNADKFVRKAQKHNTLLKLRMKKLHSYFTRPHQTHTQTFEFCYDCRGVDCPHILEYVALQMDLNATSTEIKVALVSPGGTTSVLLDFKPKIGKQVNVQKLSLLSSHFWDEKAVGTWLLHVQDRHLARNIAVHNLSLKLYGTTVPAVSNNQKQDYQHVSCQNIGKKNENTTSFSTTFSTSKSVDNEKGIRQKEGDYLMTILAIMGYSLLPVIGIIFLCCKFMSAGIPSVLCRTKAPILAPASRTESHESLPFISNNPGFVGPALDDDKQFSGSI